MQRTLQRKEIITAEAGGASDLDSEDQSASDSNSDTERVITGRKAVFLKAERLALHDESSCSEDESNASGDERESKQGESGEEEEEEGEEIDESVMQTPHEAMNKTENRQRVLILASRGITHRYRHLMSDLQTLLPHSKKEQKFDSKGQLYILNEVAELTNCNNCIFFETRKHADLYVWFAKTPNGPSIKMHVENVTTMDELRMTGNALKGSRHILSFDAQFDESPHLTLTKELLTQIFAVPKSSRKVKPFVDHVLNFSVCDGRIWVRNYQIIEQDKVRTAEAALNLVEIGPRFCMNIMRIFKGSFGGPTLYANDAFVSPNEARRGAKRDERDAHERRVGEKDVRVEKMRDVKCLPEDPADEIFA